MCGTDPFTAFREELLERVHTQGTGDHAGPAREASSEQQARRILQEELQQRDWRKPELARRRKGDAEKVAIAHRLRTETTMTLAWIAQSLSMGRAPAMWPINYARPIEPDERTKV